LYAVEIDSPQNAGTQIYYGGLVSNSPLDYVVATQNEPEILYVMTGAITPGIYKFTIGIVGRLGNETQTEWVSDLEVYFTPRRDETGSISQSPIDILKSRNDRYIDLWDVDRAIRSMAQDAPPNAAEELERALFDSDNPLNHQLIEPACETLAKLQGQASFETLVRVFSDPRCLDNIWGATAGLLQINTGQSTAFSIRSVREPKTRDGVLFRLARATKLPDALVPVIVDLAKEPNDLSSRAAAIEALGQTCDPLAISTLQAIVRDEQLDLHAPQLRAFAARALGKSADQLDSTVFEDIGSLINSSDNWVKEQAAQSLGKFRQQAAKVALRSALRDGLSSVRIGAAKSLALLNDEEAFSLIVDLAQSADASEREALIKSAIDLASTKRIPVLLALWEQMPSWIGFEEYEKSDLAMAVIDKLTELTGERLGYFDHSATITANSNARLLKRWQAWASG
jgi:HEAT repeat protein